MQFAIVSTVGFFPTITIIITITFTISIVVTDCLPQL